MFLIQATIILTFVRTCFLGVFYDQLWYCQDLLEAGDCQNNPYATLRACPISCGVQCRKYIPRVCLSSIHSCCLPNKTKFVKISVKQTFYLIFFMYVLDPCQDHFADCPNRKEECHTHPYAAAHNCPKTCEVCY